MSGFTPKDLLSQLLEDGQVSPWLLRQNHIARPQIEYAFDCGLKGFNYLFVNAWTSAAYMAGLSLARLKDGEAG